MATELGVKNAALQELGVARLTTVTDAVKSRYELDNAYANVLADCLRDGQWNFALRTTEESSDGTPAVIGMSYSITKPTDLARLVILSQNDTLDPALTDFVDEGDHWYTNVDPVYCHYVSNGTNYGGLLTGWPAEYRRFVELTLAERTCSVLTGNDNLRERIRRDLRDAKRAARSRNAMDRPAKRLPRGSWVASRGDRSATRTDRAPS
jgi:hypothetical protein